MRNTLTSLLVCLALLAPVAQGDVQGEVFALTESLLLDGSSQLPDGQVIYQPLLLDQFYADIDYRNAWPNPDQARRVVAILGGSTADGLNPADYHYDDLLALWLEVEARWETVPALRALFDVMLTDGFLLYMRHLLEGKTDPRLLITTFSYEARDFDPRTISTALQDAIARDTIEERVALARPAFPFYTDMREALAFFRQLDAGGKFKVIPTEPVLRPGDSHRNVAALRGQLALFGYPVGDAGQVELYDAELEAAVRLFQADHGLDVDGIVGRQSYDFLNLSPARRVEMLRINMDRLRWVAQDVTNDIIIVNIAGFELYYLRDKSLLWSTPVMIGTVQHQTPVFSKRLKYLEFNPTWTVPRSIIGRSLLPKFRADPGYIAANDYVLYDRSGAEVDPATIDWPNARLANFPYRVVQRPGDRNALGRVKFIFPNQYAIYLHDTPSRALFSRSARAFSAGCVRVKEPLRFAELLLDDAENWSLAQVEALVDSREPQRRVFLQRPVDVMLMYWTNGPAANDRVRFHADVYGRDAALLAALDAEPQVYGLADR